MNKVNHSEIVNKALKEYGVQLTVDFDKALGDLINEDRDFVLAMTDLDFFGTLNENFGPDEGDKVLIEFGKYIAVCIKGSGKCYRYGGDEFAIIFEGIEKEDVFLMLEGMRSSYNYELPDKTKATISIGIAANNDDASTASELIRKAEGAMVRAKQLGRNRVSLARDDKMVTKTTHYTAEQLHRLTKISKREGIGEAILLREALDALLKKYDA